MADTDSNPAALVDVVYDHFVGPLEGLVGAGLLDTEHAPGHPDCPQRMRTRWQSIGSRGFARRIGCNVHVWIVRTAAAPPSSVAARSSAYDPVNAGCARGEVIKGVPAAYRSEAKALFEARQQIARMMHAPSSDSAAFARFMLTATGRPRRA